MAGEEQARESGTIPEEQWRAWAHMARHSEEARGRIKTRRAGAAVAVAAFALLSYFLASR